ncbi:MAG: hypothetical protein ABIA04_10780 [Pseudomonadota bacterium]
MVKHGKLKQKISIIFILFSIMFSSNIFSQVLDSDLLYDEENSLYELAINTTNSLIHEIQTAQNEVQRNLLSVLCEETLELLIQSEDNENTILLLKHMAMLYSELDDSNGELFSLARLYFFRSELNLALETLERISPASKIDTEISELKILIESVLNAQEQFLKVLPSLVALYQLQLRFIDHINYETLEAEKIREASNIINKGFVEALYIEAKSVIDEKSATFQASILAIQAKLINGEIQNLGQAKNELHDLGKSLTLSGIKLENFIELSKIEDETKRQVFILSYTKKLRSNYFLKSMYPANTIMLNLEALKNSKDTAISAEAGSFYRTVTGETGITGLHDQALYQVIDKGFTEIVPLTLAMMIAAPIGASVEGYLASSRIAFGSRVIWSGSNIGKAAWVAKGIGTMSEISVFWAAHDMFHAVLIGNGEYFTAQGFLRCAIFLGGLKVLSRTWHVLAGQHLLKAAGTLPQSQALALGLLNKSGQFLTELSGFVILGRVNEALRLIPPQHLNLRSEIFCAGLFLIQLKVAVAAGNAVTNNLVNTAVVESKLSSLEANLNDSYIRGQLHRGQYEALVAEVDSMRAYISQATGETFLPYELETRLLSQNRPNPLEHGNRIQVSRDLANQAQYEGRGLGEAIDVDSSQAVKAQSTPGFELESVRDQTNPNENPGQNTILASSSNESLAIQESSSPATGNGKRKTFIPTTNQTFDFNSLPFSPERPILDTSFLESLRNQVEFEAVENPSLLEGAPAMPAIAPPPLVPGQEEDHKLPGEEEGFAILPSIEGENIDLPGQEGEDVQEPSIGENEDETIGDNPEVTQADIMEEVWKDPYVLTLIREIQKLKESGNSLFEEHLLNLLYERLASAISRVYSKKGMMLAGPTSGKIISWHEFISLLPEEFPEGTSTVVPNITVATVDKLNQILTENPMAHLRVRKLLREQGHLFDTKQTNWTDLQNKLNGRKSGSHVTVTNKDGSQTQAILAARPPRRQTRRSDPEPYDPNIAMITAITRLAEARANAKDIYTETDYDERDILSDSIELDRSAGPGMTLSLTRRVHELNLTELRDATATAIFLANNPGTWQRGYARYKKGKPGEYISAADADVNADFYYLKSLIATKAAIHIIVDTPMDLEAIERLLITQERGFQLVKQGSTLQDSSLTVVLNGQVFTIISPYQILIPYASFASNPNQMIRAINFGTRLLEAVQQDKLLSTEFKHVDMSSFRPVFDALFGITQRTAFRELGEFIWQHLPELKANDGPFVLSGKSAKLLAQLRKQGQRLTSPRGLTYKLKEELEKPDLASRYVLVEDKLPARVVFGLSMNFDVQKARDVIEGFDPDLEIEDRTSETNWRKKGGSRSRYRVEYRFNHADSNDPVLVFTLNIITVAARSYDEFMYAMALIDFLDAHGTFQTATDNIKKTKAGLTPIETHFIEPIDFLHKIYNMWMTRYLDSEAWKEAKRTGEKVAEIPKSTPWLVETINNSGQADVMSRYLFVLETVYGTVPDEMVTKLGPDSISLHKKLREKIQEIRQQLSSE